MTREQFSILNNHLGYGNPNAEIIFIGLEEGCNINSISHNYKYRYTNSNCLPALNNFHIDSPIADMKNWFILKKKQSTWSWYSKLMINYLKLTITPLDYQLSHLGQSSDKTALLEFYPLPRPNHNYWDYALNVSGQWSDISAYKAYCSDASNKSTLNRFNSLNTIVLKNKKSKAVIIHGSINKNQDSYQVKNQYRMILELFGLDDIPFVTHILDTLEDGRNVIALEYNIEGKKIFFTHFFGQGAMTNIGINTLSTLI